jgi:predicted Zn-dependent protease
VNSAQREALAQRVLARSKAEQTEVSVSVSDASLTRFARGISNQNVSTADRTIAVRAIVDGKTGVAATSSIDDASLDALVARALEIASLAPSDPDIQPLPESGPVQTPPTAYVAQTAEAGPALRAEICAAIFEPVETADYWCAGYVSTSSTGLTVVNSSGAIASFDGTDAGANVKVTAPDSTGFAERYAANIAQIDGTSIGTLATEKARASAQPRAVEPGEWTVILEPAAFGELFGYLTSHFSAQSFNDGSSFFAGNLGGRYFSNDITIFDDFAHPLAPGMPFDYEGAVKRRVTLVDRGTVMNYVTDSYYAKKLGVANTGHALPAPNAYGPQATNVVMAPGSATTKELIASTERGLLITRFWYIRTVDQKKAIVTGMTRDGTFLIEDGHITGGVKNLRFNQSIIDALAHATLSSDQHRTAQYSYSLVVPSAKIEGFRFTSSTQF